MIVSEYDQFGKEGEFEAMGGLDGLINEYEDRIEELEKAISKIAELTRAKQNNTLRLANIQAIADKYKSKGDDESERQ